MGFKRWWEDQKACYFGNAQTVRDLRTQLRGNRPIWLWSCYLFLLVVTTGFSYSVMTPVAGGFATTDVSSLQGALKALYGVLIATIWGMIALIAPALTAAAISTERQRRSLDLVFSAPVSPKYLLVGKMLSTYRYVWMLLVLSVPFSSVAVVLGGATAWDVFADYVSMSFVGLIFSSIGLMISCLSTRTILAVIYSYLAVLGYLILAIPLAGLFIYSMALGTRAVPDWQIALSLFSGLGAVGRESTTVTLTSLLLMVGAALYLVKLLLAGAGSALAERAGKETASLRALSLILIAFLGIAASENPGVSLARSAVDPVKTIFLGMIGFTIFLPTLTCFGVNGSDRTRNDGFFRFRTALSGTPAGALPYLLLCITVAFGPLYWHHPADPQAWALAGYTYALWFFFWGIGRFWSRQCATLSVAKGAHFISMLTLIALPDAIAAANGIEITERNSLVFTPLHNNSVDFFVTNGVALFLVGALLAYNPRSKRMSVTHPEVANG